jgi:hypothetical protein
MNVVEEHRVIVDIASGIVVAVIDQVGWEHADMKLEDEAVSRYSTIIKSISECQWFFILNYVLYTFQIFGVLPVQKQRADCAHVSHSSFTHSSRIIAIDTFAQRSHISS